ncbi:MAG TPA: hypothetical protein VEV19_12600 [Ktedonobacteraceae bacterium]|nr:hypothetical protein [Ktedonobacteraceae bacterium]
MDNMDMHEQSSVPESQSHQSQGQHFQDEQNRDYPAQPYYWSTKPDSPKDEPASLYDDPMVQSDTPHDYQHGYSMQNNINAGYNYNEPLENSTRTSEQPSATYGQQSQSRSRYQQQQYSPDGDAFEQQYRYGSSGHANYWQWSVPAWARPQRQRSSASRWFWFILLALLFMGPLMHLLGFLLVVGVILLTLLFPFIIVALFSIPFVLSRALFGRPLPQRRWRYTRFWRMNNTPWRW